MSNIPLYWTAIHVFYIFVLVMIGWSMGLSKKNPVWKETVIIVFSLTYLVLNLMCWWYLLFQTSWFGNEQIFDYSFEPILPAVSFYLGLFIIVVLLWNWINLLKSRYTYKIGQKIGFSLAYLVLIIAITLQVLTPIRLQLWINTLESLK